MKYSANINPKLKLFCEELNNYLFNEKHIVLNELSRLISYFGSEDENSIRGILEFHIHSKTRAENGTVTTHSETISFTAKGCFIKSFSQEDYFGEYYTNNEVRIGEDELEEHVSEYLENSFKAITRILKVENGYFEVKNNKFDIK